MLRVSGRFESSMFVCRAVTTAILVAALSAAAAAQNVADKDPTLREYQGTAESIQGYVFSARVEGVLNKINFVPGQVVKKGDLVFEFAPTSKMLVLERSRAQRERAEADYRKAEYVLGRFKKLGKTDSIPKNRIEDAEIARDIAAAKLKEARANEKLAEVALKNMQLRAPFTGIMSPPYVPPGTFMDLDSRTSRPLAKIVQMDPIWVVSKVPYDVYYERRMAAKSEKATLERATWTLVLPNGKVYPHSSRLVSAHYELDRGTQTLATRAVFPNPDFLLRPGLEVTVQSRIKGE